MTAIHNFSLDQGSDKVVYFVLRDKSGPIDLSGYSAAMQVRRYAFSEAAIDTLTTCNGRLLIDGPAGKITAKFNHANTEQYPGDTVLYDIELESPEGAITRILEGKIKVSPEVTRVRCKPKA